MPRERSRDPRRGRIPGSYTPAIKDSTQNERIGIYGYLRGKSSLMIFQKYGNMKFAYRNREFWCKGHYVDTVGKNTKVMKSYIENQLKQDREADQLSLFDPRDPFTGGR